MINGTRNNLCLQDISLLILITIQVKHLLFIARHFPYIIRSLLFEDMNMYLVF